MSRKSPTWKDIKPALASMKADQLRKILQDLYGFSPENKAFFHARFLSEMADHDPLAPYRVRIREAVCPEQPWKQGVRLSAGRKAISEFKKANGNQRDTLALMLYYVECGNDFTLEFGDIDEPFYDSMDSMFASIVRTLIKQQSDPLAAEFLPALATEAKRVECLGWGYGDALREHMEDLRDAFPDVTGNGGTRPAPKDTIVGDWRIVWMAVWEQDFVDLDGPGMIRIGPDGRGEFSFGAVTGSFTGNPTARHFTSRWEGSDEMDEARGDIDGTLDEEGHEGALFGELSFWNGDESEYRAVRVAP